MAFEKKTWKSVSKHTDGEIKKPAYADMVKQLRTTIPGKLDKSFPKPTGGKTASAVIKGTSVMKYTKANKDARARALKHLKAAANAIESLGQGVKCYRYKAPK